MTPTGAEQPTAVTSNRGRNKARTFTTQTLGQPLRPDKPGVRKRNGSGRVTTRPVLWVAGFAVIEFVRQRVLGERALPDPQESAADVA